VTALGFFEKVDISTKRGSGDDKMDVNIEVSERPTGTFQIGAGFSSVENFIARPRSRRTTCWGAALVELQAQLSSLPPTLPAGSIQDLYSRFQLDLRLPTSSAGPVSLLVRAPLEGREPHLGLPAGKDLRLC